jgi:hypothetical protein
MDAQGGEAGVDAQGILEDWLGDPVWVVVHRCLVEHGDVPPSLLGVWAQRLVSWAPKVSAAFVAAAELLRIYSVSGGANQSARLLAAQFLACCDEDLLDTSRAISEHCKVLGLAPSAATEEHEGLLLGSDGTSCRNWVETRLGGCAKRALQAQLDMAVQPGSSIAPHLGTLEQVPVICGDYCTCVLGVGRG